MPTSYFLDCIRFFVFVSFLNWQNIQSKQVIMAILQHLNYWCMPFGFLLLSIVKGISGTLTSKYSSIPYLEPSLPRPDCLTPPKGATFIHTDNHEYTNMLFKNETAGGCSVGPTSVEIKPSLTPTSPYSRASETRHERWTLFVNM